MTTLYSILRPKGIGFVLLLSATSLDEAAGFMRSRGLTKCDERSFPSHGLTQWIVQ